MYLKNTEHFGQRDLCFLSIHHVLASTVRINTCNSVRTVRALLPSRWKIFLQRRTLSTIRSVLVQKDWRKVILSSKNLLEFVDIKVVVVYNLFINQSIPHSFSDHLFSKFVSVQHWDMRKVACKLDQVLAVGIVLFIAPQKKRDMFACSLGTIQRVF